MRGIIIPISHSILSDALRISSPKFWSELPPEISKGKVKKMLFYSKKGARAGDLTEVSCLFLEPGAQILEHKHTIDCEIYIVLAGEDCKPEVLLCKCGQTHSFYNNFGKPIKIIASKMKVSPRHL